MRGGRLLLVLAPFLLAGSAVAQVSSSSAANPLHAALSEQATAERRAAELQQAAEKAQGAAAKLRAQQDAAAQAIEAAEARITAANIRLQLLSRQVARQRQALAREQRPISSLLAGLGLMARRPPLLALADRGSAEELVRTRILLDATMPVIARRTAAASEQVRAGERMRADLQAARAELMRSNQALRAQRSRFATLEREALSAASAAGGSALNAGDAALAAGEAIERLRSDQTSRRSINALAGVLARDGLPPGPAPSQARGPVPFAYALPVSATVTGGLGSVSENGIKSRGITMEAARGAQVRAPAAGTIRFAGPFRNYDGVIIIDHGDGWAGLIVNVTADAKVGDRVSIGQPIGRALGAIDVELSRNGRYWSPALIAGSSAGLSNRRQDR